MQHKTTTRRFFGALILGALLLAGCGQSVPSYSVLGKQEGPAAKAIFVEVPAHTSRNEMTGIGQELEKTEKVAGKSLMVSFFHGGQKPENSVGTYENGMVY